MSIIVRAVVDTGALNVVGRGVRFFLTGWPSVGLVASLTLAALKFLEIQIKYLEKWSAAEAHELDWFGIFLVQQQFWVSVGAYGGGVLLTAVVVVVKKGQDELETNAAQVLCDYLRELIRTYVEDLVSRHQLKRDDIRVSVWVRSEDNIHCLCRPGHGRTQKAFVLSDDTALKDADGLVAACFIKREVHFVDALSKEYDFQGDAPGDLDAYLAQSFLTKRTDLSDFTWFGAALQATPIKDVHGMDGVLLIEKREFGASLQKHSWSSTVTKWLSKLLRDMEWYKRIS